MDTGTASLVTHAGALHETTTHDAVLPARCASDDVICMPAGSLVLPGGTLIETPDGPRPLETLASGSAIVLLHGNLGTISRLSQIRTAHHVDARLICIRADAISAGIPQFDLILPADVTLCLHGKTLPVRCLVNNTSIAPIQISDTSTCYEIKTEASGYLKAHDVIIGPILPKTAPRSFVEPLYHALTARSHNLGYGPAPRPHTLRYDPDLHLLTDTGRVIQPARQTRDRVVFLLDAPVTYVTIASRADCPSATLGPFVDDHRILGILIGQISIYDGSGCHELSNHLTDGELGGWNACDSDNARWTRGDAILPLHTREAVVLTLQICAAGPYRSALPPFIQTTC